MKIRASSDRWNFRWGIVVVLGIAKKGNLAWKADDDRIADVLLYFTGACLTEDRATFNEESNIADAMIADLEELDNPRLFELGIITEGNVLHVFPAIER